MPFENNPILTIAIPTYNRSNFLDRCLSQIVNQAVKYGNKVELIVSDNCSTDDTEAVVNAYIANGHKIHYIKNASNLGPDGNFRQCFKAANGKYFLLFSDDDLLLDDSLRKIMNLIEVDEYGIVYLSNYFFKTDYLRKPNRKKRGIIIFNDLNKFIRKVDVWFTFISSNVINKSLVDPHLDLNDFAATNLQQLAWTFSSLFNSSKNIFYDEYLVAAQLDNTGGYKFCEVFGKHMHTVFMTFINKYGVSNEHFEIIVRKMLKKHLSKYILSARKDFGSYHEEDFFNILHPIYKPYLSYWIFVYPAIRWPLPLAKIWCKVSRFFAKLCNLL
ncbi:MAG: glycosyltransferase family 2 protein [Desulfuromonadaceae bacterium]|nr:glycosyltransferase family 2 protein [Desulfuromonadaceae bacterium]